MLDAVSLSAHDRTLTQTIVLQKTARGNMFTHHQKTIVLDGPPKAAGSGVSPGLRQIISFVGGLDLCDGRYDTGEHCLYKTTRPGGAHYEDFHQACIDGEGGCLGVGRHWSEFHLLVYLVVAMPSSLQQLPHL
jgi:phospholipase D1/2